MKVVITRPRQQADSFAESLVSAGMEPIFFPVIEIQPMHDDITLRRALINLASYHWVVFTSVNGVKIVCDMLDSLHYTGMPAQVKVAAIGPKTAEALVESGITPVYVPGEYIAEAIVPGMGDLSGKQVLLPRAEIARKSLAQAITAAGGIVEEVAVYRTLPVQPDERGLSAIRQGVDVVTLTSSSIVRNFSSMVRQAGLDPQHLPGNPVYACIGPITEQTAREECLPNLVMAQEYTTAGLLRVIERLTKR